MKSSDKKIVDEINITPLTDIFLVLLIIMMVVAPMLHHRGLPVSFSAPGAAAESSVDSKALLIVVNGLGQFVVSGEEVFRQDLLDRMQNDEGAREDGVVVQVDPEASIEAMTYVLNAAQLAKIEKVSVEEGTGKE